MLDWPDFWRWTLPSPAQTPDSSRAPGEMWGRGITSVPEVENDSPEAYAWERAWPLWFTTSEDRALGLMCSFLMPAGPLSVPGPGIEAWPQVGTTVAFAPNFMAFADVRWHPNPLSLSSSYFHAVSFT